MGNTVDRDWYQERTHGELFSVSVAHYYTACITYTAPSLPLHAALSLTGMYSRRSSEDRRSCTPLSLSPLSYYWCVTQNVTTPIRNRMTVCDVIAVIARQIYIDYSAHINKLHRSPRKLLGHHSVLLLWWNNISWSNI